MPQLAPVSLKAGNAVVHTFKPKSPSASGTNTLTENNGVPAGDGRLVITTNRTPAGRNKVSVKLVMPVLSAVTTGGTSDYKVVRTAYADLTFQFDDTSTTAERLDMRSLVNSLTGSTLGEQIIDALEGLY